MNNEKTIKQLADEIGVSKTAINKKITENFKRKHFKKIGNKFLIDSAGQNAVKAMFFSNKNEKRKPEVFENENFGNQKVSEVTDLVFVLKERLEISDKQNIIKDQQIEKLQKLLDQQQILTLQANKKIEELELKSNEGESRKKENEFSFSEEQEKNQEMKKEDSSIDKNMPGTSDKKKFWARWFKK